VTTFLLRGPFYQKCFKTPKKFCGQIYSYGVSNCTNTVGQQKEVKLGVHKKEWEQDGKT